MIRIRPPAVAVLAICAVMLAVPAAAQETRRALIDRAIADFDRTETTRLLMLAVDPDRAPPDSLWTFAVHYLAETLLLDLDDAEAASLWLQWQVRHGASVSMNAELFRAPAVELHARVALAVERSRGPGDEWTRTTWRWPALADRMDRRAPGTLVITGIDPNVAVQAAIAGRGPVQSGASLPPGSYELEIVAEGHEMARITREVLPGVTTVLELDPPPLLPDGVQADVAARLALIAWTEGGVRRCVDGLVDGDGVVLAVFDAPGATRTFEVTTPAGTFRRVPIVRQDPAGLVALRIDGLSSTAASSSSGARDGQYVWSVHREGCAAPVSARSRLTQWREPPAGAVQVAPLLPAAAVGSPLVDRAGGVLGLVTAADEIMPLSLARAFASEAIARLPEARPQRRGGLGVWKWVGGAGVVGVLAVALLGGSDSSPGGGTIVLHIPGG